jgi:2-polyprenyl-3-methyl-5-hydroxy-6-metoxy-1,4-benzoquinol methylase
MTVSNEEVRRFWEDNPVAAEGLAAQPGTAAFYKEFDALRESDYCEPWEFSNRIHGYTSSAGKSVLDIGCGNGYVLAQYAKYGARVSGIDLTQTALRLTRARFDLGGLEVDLKQTDGDRIPYPDATFDIVCSMGVLHHIENPRPMIEEIRRVLKPGGTVIIMLYHRHSWKYQVVLRAKRILDPRYWGKSQAEALNFNDGADCPLAKVYSKAETRELLSEFKDIRMALNLLTWRQLFLVPGLDRLLAPILPKASESLPARWMGWSLFAIGRKAG